MQRREPTSEGGSGQLVEGKEARAWRGRGSCGASAEERALGRTRVAPRTRSAIGPCASEGGGVHRLDAAGRRVMMPDEVHMMRKEIYDSEGNSARVCPYGRRARCAVRREQPTRTRTRVTGKSGVARARTVALPFLFVYSVIYRARVAFALLSTRLNLVKRDDVVNAAPVAAVARPGQAVRSEAARRAAGSARALGLALPPCRGRLACQRCATVFSERELSLPESSGAALASGGRARSAPPPPRTPPRSYVRRRRRID